MGVAAGLIVVGGVSATVRPLSRASVVSGLEAKLRAAETTRAAKLPGRPEVSCSALAPSAGAPVGVQCVAETAGGRIVEAVAGTVRCGARGEPACVRPASCVYAVSVFAPPPKVISTYSVNACSSKS